MNRAKDIVPASSGDTSQLAAMVPTFSQCTASMPIPTAAKPTMAPTIEWVVETGEPFMVAIISQVPAASSADSMPYTINSGLPDIDSASIMPWRMVAVTSPPAR